MKNILKLTAILFIVLTSSVFVHEFYHYLTSKDVIGYGVDLSRGQVAYVCSASKYAMKNEVIAYTIQIIYIFLALVFLDPLKVRNKQGV